MAAAIRLPALCAGYFHRLGGAALQASDSRKNHPMPDEKASKLESDFSGMNPFRAGNHGIIGKQNFRSKTRAGQHPVVGTDGCGGVGGFGSSAAPAFRTGFRCFIRLFPFAPADRRGGDSGGAAPGLDLCGVIAPLAPVAAPFQRCAAYL